jgi:type 1 fimbriae regulatory protein FimB
VPIEYILVVKAIVGNEQTIDERQKNFLTEAEIETFLKSSRRGRHGVRNFAMMLLAYRHALRVSELVNIRMADLDLDTGRLFVRRNKGSLSTSQPLEGDEIRAMRRWLRQRINAPCCNSPLLFLSERGPMTRQAINYTVAEIGKRAALPVHVHPHMRAAICQAELSCDLRHIFACLYIFYRRFDKSSAM